MTDSRPILIVMCGPTAVGKTAAAIGVAQCIGGEIVNADSRSFYVGMDIGTAKPAPEDRAIVPHHLIDILDPADDMSLARFQALAFSTIDEILHRGVAPMLVGGTAQYLNAVMENWAIPEVPPDHAWRREMEARVDADGIGWLTADLQRADPASLDRTGPNPRRMIRALEVFRATGRPMSEQIGRRPPRYRTIAFELWAPRDVLHARIAARVDLQIASGLFDEVAGLLEHGVDPGLPSFQTIGYREVVPYLRGFRSEQETRDAIVHASNRLVRHQQTWFRKMPGLNRIDVTTDDPVQTMVRAIRRI
jgi:tRNA dimethylallyltransferase